jgi:hypothetical protein
MSGHIKTHVQLGDSNTPANNFTLTSQANDGSMKLARGNFNATTQDVMTVDAAGKPDFTQLAKSLGVTGSDGYITLPGGLIIQWGETNANISSRDVTFPFAFPTALYFVSVIPIKGSTLTATPAYTAAIGTKSLSGFSCAVHYDLSGTPAFAAEVGLWIAIGK